MKYIKFGEKKNGRYTKAEEMDLKTFKDWLKRRRELMKQVKQNKAEIQKLKWNEYQIERNKKRRMNKK